MKLTQEVWGETKPLWDSLVAYAANTEMRLMKVLEWRVNPHDIRLGRLTEVAVMGPTSRQQVLGAPLVIDATVPEGVVRVLHETYTVEVGE